MSDSAGIHTRPDEDARSTLAMVAGQNQRRNAPKALPLLGAVVFMIAALSLGFQCSAHKAASQRLTGASRQASEVNTILASIESLTLKSLEGGAGIGPPLPDLLTRIDRAAERAGIDIGAPTDGGDTREGVKARTVGYRLSNQQLGPTMDWISRALSGTPGLELYDYDMRPMQIVRRRGQDAGSTGGGWNINVTFRRLEQE